MTAEDITEVVVNPKPEEKQEAEPVSEHDADEEQNTADDAPLVDKETQSPKPSVHKNDYEEHLVYLYCTPRSALLPSLSPFCLKVESWLRLADVKYEMVEHKMKLRSRKGQLPFVEVNGEEIADSAVIIKELSRRNEADLDASLTTQQRGVASCATAMLENHFFWVIKAWRSKNPDQMLQAYKMDLQKITGKTWPKPILNFLYKRRQRKSAKDIEVQGFTMNTDQEIESLGQNDLKEVAELLDDQEYFFGNSPTTLDAVVFANLAQLVYMDPDTECNLRAWLVENHPKLVAFCHRFKERVFPDWEEICNKKTKDDVETQDKDEADKGNKENTGNEAELESDQENLNQDSEKLKAESEKVNVQMEKNLQDAERNKRDAEKNKKDAMKNKKDAEKNRKDSIKIKKDSFRLKKGSKKVKKNKSRDSASLDDNEASNEEEKRESNEEEKKASIEEADIKEKLDDETEKDTLKSEEITT